MNRKSFVRGAAILGIAGLFGKVIGAFYRIPLANIIGAEGAGLYSLAYPVYAALLVISTAGIPTAISRMVSEKKAVGDHEGAHKVFTVSLKLLTAIGLLTTIIMIAGNRFFAELIGNEKSSYSFLAIAPALFLVSILSAYRGYFQGMQMMEPTAVSQVVEQCGKLVLGLGLAYQWRDMGPQYGAAGALAGVTLSELAALVLLLGVYHRKKKDLKEEILNSRKNTIQEGFRQVALRLIGIAVPITLGASIMPIVSFIDASIVINRLKAIGLTAGYATELYGLLTFIVNPLINMPAVLTIALAMSLVPAISESYALKDMETVREKSATGIRLALLLGLPAAAGLFLLARPIVALLYRSYSSEQLDIAAALLRTMAAAVLFLSLVQTLTGILQGLGKERTPVGNLFIGAVLKVALSYFLIGIPHINIQGATAGTVVCYAVAAVLNFINLVKRIGMKMNVKDVLVKPIISVAGMSVIVWIVSEWARNMNKSNTVVAFSSILAGILGYFALLLLTGALQQEDMDYLPGGKKVGKMMRRLGIWK